jgi:hypothetical protein
MKEMILIAISRKEGKLGQLSADSVICTVYPLPWLLPLWTLNLLISTSHLGLKEYNATRGQRTWAKELSCELVAMLSLRSGSGPVCTASEECGVQPDLPLAAIFGRVAHSAILCDRLND